MSNFIKIWTQKEIDHLTRGFRRYSGLVFVLKFVLPLTALAMLGILVIYPHFSGRKNAIHLHAKQTADSPQDLHPEMINPKFQGLDSKGEQYQIVAQKAVNESPTLLRLFDVTGDITLNNGSWVSGYSKHGLYDRDKRTLTLVDDVNVFLTDKDDKITHLVGSEVFIDIDSGIAKSEKPVKAKSDSGDFWASGFTSYRDTQKINFSGPIKLIILRK